MNKLKNIIVFTLLISSFVEAHEDNSDESKYTIGSLSSPKSSPKVVQKTYCDILDDEENNKIAKPKKIEVETVSYIVTNCNTRRTFPVTVRSNSNNGGN